MSQNQSDDKAARQKAAAMAAALLNAARNGDVAGVRRLLGQGASANVRTPQGVPVLTLAVAADKPASVVALLAAGADPNARDRECGYRPFADVKSLPVARALIKGGVDLDAKCFNGLVPLEMAARKGEVEMVELLLEHGAQVPKAMRQAAYWEGLGARAEQAQRLIAAHHTARRLEVAMGGPENSVNRASSGIMKPL